MRKLKDQTEIGSIFGESVSVRKVNGRIIITNRPKRRRGQPTEKEIAHRQNLAEAATYAKSISKDAALLALYATGVRKKHESPQSVAIGDFLNPPKVDLITVDEHNGEVGNIIHVQATDDFQVTRVTIAITDAEGAAIEQGDASDDSSNRPHQWEYKSAVTSLKGMKVVAVAYDRPGNKAVLEVKL